MTTIAYRAGIIACDSRATEGDTIITDRCRKYFRKGGWRFWLAGATSQFAQFVVDCASDCPKTSARDVYGFAVMGDVVFRVDCIGGRVNFDRIDEEYDAVGSGQCFALAAMDAGATAAEAVRIAARRDPGTGGRVRVYLL